jgi:hypothetical protein
MAVAGFREEDDMIAKRIRRSSRRGRARGGFTPDEHTVKHCQAVFLAMDDDAHLDCNVTHRHAARTAGGWAGPGDVSAGFVHNRRFGGVLTSEMIPQVDEMVFAARL